MLTCMLSHFNHVRLSEIPWTMARQAPLSVGFSRQEYWTGLPFPSPVIKYEVSEVKEVKLLSRVQLPETPWTPTRLLHSWDFPGKSTGVGCHCLLSHVSTPDPKFSQLRSSREVNVDVLLSLLENQASLLPGQGEKDLFRGYAEIFLSSELERRTYLQTPASIFALLH